jgi:hypothetical protein
VWGGGVPRLRVDEDEAVDEVRGVEGEVDGGGAAEGGADEDDGAADVRLDEGWRGWRRGKGGVYP